MRSASLCSIAALAVLAIGCGNGGQAKPSHPTLDQDYSARFVGTWQGAATLAFTGQAPQMETVSQRIDRTGVNRLSIAGLCGDKEGAAGLDSATAFSIDPIACAPTQQSCGAVTVRYDSGSGALAGDTLTMSLAGNASGCGHSLNFTLTFAGHLPAQLPPPPPPPPSVDHGPPLAAVAAGTIETDVGVPVGLDARPSTDPDGRALTFAWTVTSWPTGSDPALSGADTATPVFTAAMSGQYMVKVVVSASDAQSAAAFVAVFVHDALVPGQSSVRLLSDPGDYIGAGGFYEYTQADAVIGVNASAGHLTIGITGDQSWSADFQMPSGFTQLQPGTYDGLMRFPFHDPARGGFNWSGEGRGCNMLTASVVIDAVRYSGGALSAIDLRFDQHCEGGAPALHGQIHWDASDPTVPSGPAVPRADLWHAPSGSVPASGNYVYLQSGAGDWVGDGATFTYTQADAVLSVTASARHLTIGINGDEQWTGDFEGMSSIALLQAGYYADLERYPFHNPVRGGLNWSGEGRGCNTLTGWFVVDSLTYSGTTLTAIDLRFEQHCEGGSPALHGQIHWDASDPTQPPGPVDPPPDTLWQPAPGATPAAGSFVYLKADPGDYIGAGGTYTYTKADSLLSIGGSGHVFSITIRGDENWFADFAGMSTISRLQPGYYPNLQRYPFNNPVRGGLEWSGEGRGCNTLTGWFVVDAVTYSGSTLTAIDLRFEQHCEGGGPALHGQVHWDSSDTTQPPGPEYPPPADLWQPLAGATPATGNYVYLKSDPGDYIGQGSTHTYTPANATISVSASANRASVSLSTVNFSDWWSGDFQGMSSIALLRPGYYPDLERYPFYNPVRGGLDWTGEGRGCNTLTGWFVVDSVTYADTALTSIDLRFEQHCEGGFPALHGQIHWVVN